MLTLASMVIMIVGILGTSGHGNTPKGQQLFFLLAVAGLVGLIVSIPLP